MSKDDEFLEARQRVARLEDRVENCRAVVQEVQRQGRFHLLSTAQLMLDSAERALTAERDELIRQIALCDGCDGLPN